MTHIPVPVTMTARAPDLATGQVGVMDFRYDPTDPYQVTLTIDLQTFTVAREHLAAVAADQDVRTHGAEFLHGVISGAPLVFVHLRTIRQGPHGPVSGPADLVSVRVGRYRFREFIAAVRQEVPDGMERFYAPYQDQMDDALNALLGRS